MPGEPARIHPPPEQLWKEPGGEKTASASSFVIGFCFALHTGSSGGGWKMSKSVRLIAWEAAAITHRFLIANLKLLVIYYQPIENCTLPHPTVPHQGLKTHYLTWRSNQSIRFFYFCSPNYISDVWGPLRSPNSGRWPSASRPLDFVLFPLRPTQDLPPECPPPLRSYSENSSNFARTGFPKYWSKSYGTFIWRISIGDSIAHLSLL